MRSWAEVNLDNIAHNISAIRRNLSAGTKILAVIKADGYGHGYRQVAITAIENGVDFFGVALADEAMQLRNDGFDVPILVLGPVEDDEFVHVVDKNISVTVFDIEIAKRLSAVATALGKKAKIHIKLDTGMTRIGYMASEVFKVESAIDEIVEISKLPNIVIEGIFTHFAKADEPDSDYTKIQFNRFISMCDALEECGVDVGIRHCCNSGGIINYPEYHLDMVRSGIITYGYYPSEETFSDKLDLRPAMQLKSRITDVKTVPEGVAVSYGGTYVTEKSIDIATICIGYADGYFRSLSNKASVIVGGKTASVIGRVCMDQTMVDVTGIKNIKIGDEVILFGTDGNNTITVDSVAQLAGTINYEVLSVVGKRVPRVYIKDGRVVNVLNYLV